MIKILEKIRFIYLLSTRHFIAQSIRKRKRKILINYGCGINSQEGYINVDIRYTPVLHLVGDLRWCSKYLRNSCDEVYLSHVLEHYGYPGKAFQKTENSVLSALEDIYDMLVPEGVVRVAVPDFSALAELYVLKKKPLFPKLSGRLCGEQNYPQNVHRCAFDRAFLIHCLEQSGFSDVSDWHPQDLGFGHDSSYDSIDGIQTSLNLVAKKIAHP